MSMADRIDARLKQLGLSRRAASEKAKLSETFIRDLIEGRAKSPRVESLEKLAAALDTNVEWLRTGAGDPNQVPDVETAQVLRLMPHLSARRRAEAAKYIRFLSEQDDADVAK